MTPFVKKIALPALAATMAATVALTPLTATPARADSTGAAVAATGFLALLMAGILAGSQAQASVQTPPADHDRPHGWPVNPGQRPGYAPRPVQQQTRTLPRECRVTYRLGSSAAPYYETSCLIREMPGWQRLPQRCEQTIRIKGSGSGTHRAYAESCLLNAGYRVGRW